MNHIVISYYHDFKEFKPRVTFNIALFYHTLMHILITLLRLFQNYDFSTIHRNVKLLMSVLICFTPFYVNAQYVCIINTS